ncbi:hypothetical protein, partial [Vibrio parahaemolyticus]|uniref:hypothetical protein n=1 Tax=Vibrio parahaemolyticus TaxID=670 RepID=UPI001A8D91B3
PPPSADYIYPPAQAAASESSVQQPMIYNPQVEPPVEPFSQPQQSNTLQGFEQTQPQYKNPFDNV